MDWLGPPVVLGALRSYASDTSKVMLDSAWALGRPLDHLV